MSNRSNHLTSYTVVNCKTSTLGVKSCWAVELLGRMKHVACLAAFDAARCVGCIAAALAVMGLTTAQFIAPPQQIDLLMRTYYLRSSRNYST